MTRVAFFTVAGLLVAQLALGEDFWSKKAYTEWTREEVQKIKNNSPWAKEVTVSLNAPSAPNVGGEPNGTINIDDGGGARPEGGAIGGASGGGRGRGGAGQQSTTMVIEWRSSLPLKEALFRGRLLAGDESLDAKTLDTAETKYVIVISGVPANIGRAAQQSEVAQQSTLKIDKKDPIHPMAAHFEPHGQTMEIFLAFPRTKPIVLEDNEVEVIVKLGTFDAKKKFKLKDMVFNGKLEL